MKIQIWHDTTPQIQIQKIVNKIYKKLIKQYLPSLYTPIFIRIIGQSGSGKSTQILPAVTSANPSTLVLSVGMFVNYYTGEDKSREITNGFCLRILTSLLYKLLPHKINIILDMTLLSKKYENDLVRCLQQNNYDLFVMALSVPKKQSNIFIKKRETETKRKVNKSSARYFYDKLLPSFKLLSRKMPNAKCIIWSAYDKEPLFNNQIAFAVPIFRKARKKIKSLFYTEAQLLDEKTSFLLTYNFYNCHQHNPTS